MERAAASRPPRSRRDVLRSAAVAGSLVLAGCTEDVGEELPANEHWPVADLAPDPPVHQQTGVLEDAIKETSADRIEDVDGFVAALSARGLDFESVEEVVEALHLAYVEADLEGRGTLETIGLVAGAYAALVGAGFEARALELVVFGPEGDTVGVVEAATEWAAAFDEGALSAAEYGELVTATIESRRDPPEPDVAPDE